MYKRSLFFGLLALLFCGTLSAVPVVVNGPAPLKTDAQITGSAAWEKIYLIAIIYPKLDYSVRSGELFNDLLSRYAAQGLEVYAVLPLPLNDAQSFAQAHADFRFTLCADLELKTISKLLNNDRKDFPASFLVNQAGKLLWSGDPIDLEMMLKIIMGKRYSERDEIRISVLADHLQAALRSGDFLMIEKAADDLLKERPEQLSALNAKAFALEQSGNYQALEAMFKKRIQKHPEWPESYFMLLEAAARRPELSKNISYVAQAYCQQFPQDANGINAIAWRLLTDASSAMTAPVFQAAEAAVKQLQTLKESQTDSRMLVTQALYFYRKCDLQKATQFLKQAEATASSESEKSYIRQFLQYLEVVSAN